MKEVFRCVYRCILAVSRCIFRCNRLSGVISRCTGFHQIQHLDWFSGHGDPKKAAVVIVGKFDLRPLLQGAFDAGTEAVIGKKTFGDVGNQNRIADMG